MAASSTVHVLYNGRTDDLGFDQVFPQERRDSIGIRAGVEPSVSTLTPDQVKTALSQYYDVGLNEFQDHFVDLNPNGNITVRPNATFGKKA